MESPPIASGCDAEPSPIPHQARAQRLRG